MSCTGDQPRSGFCVCYKQESSKWRIFINYVSEPREDRSIKIPDVLLVEASDRSKQSSNARMETTTREAELDNQSIKAQIEASFEACYGTGVPNVCTTENGKDLVMSVKIYQSHWEILNKLPFKQPKRAFLSVVFKLIRVRLLRTVDGAPKRIKLSPFRCELVGLAKRQGRSATKDKIRSILLDSTATYEEQPRAEPPSQASSAIRVGDHLLSLSMRHLGLDRIVHFRLIAHDKLGSIELPQSLVNMAYLGSFGVHLMAMWMGLEKIACSMFYQTNACLGGLYWREGPMLWLFRNRHRGRKDILIEVPIHIKHAWIVSTYLIQPVRLALVTSIMAFYDIKYLQDSNRMLRLLDVETKQDGILWLPGLA